MQQILLVEIIMLNRLFFIPKCYVFNFLFEINIAYRA